MAIFTCFEVVIMYICIYIYTYMYMYTIGITPAILWSSEIFHGIYNP